MESKIIDACILLYKDGEHNIFDSSAFFVMDAGGMTYDYKIVPIYLNVGKIFEQNGPDFYKVYTEQASLEVKKWLWRRGYTLKETNQFLHIKKHLVISPEQNNSEYFLETAKKYYKETINNMSNIK